MGNFIPAGIRSFGKSGFWGPTAVKKSAPPAGTWTARPAYPLGAVSNMAGTSTRMVALDGNGGVAYSDDGGATWQLGSGFSGANNGVGLAVNANGSLWVAVCPNGVTLTSPDGKTWTVAGAISPIFGFPVILFGGGIFMVGTISSAENVDVFTSPDGVTWTGQGVATPNQLAPLCYDGTRFIAAAKDAGGSNTVIATSTDGGATWTQALVPQFNPNGVNQIAFHAGITVATTFGSPSFVQSATNAAAWTPPTTITQPLTDDANGLAFGNGVWCLVGDVLGGPFPQAATSVDLSTWVLEDMDLGAGEIESVAAVAFAGGKLVAWTFDGKVTTRN